MADDVRGEVPTLDAFVSRLERLLCPISSSRSKVHRIGKAVAEVKTAMRRAAPAGVPCVHCGDTFEFHRHRTIAQPDMEGRCYSVTGELLPTRYTVASADAGE